MARAACKALFALTTGDDDSDAEIANCGGSKIVIEAMRAHRASADIQEQACRGEQASEPAEAKRLFYYYDEHDVPLQSSSQLRAKRS